MLALLLFQSCYKLRGHYGGEQSFEATQRPVQPTDVALPKGYKMEAVATGLTYPTGVTFDDAGNVYVVEAGYSYGEIWTTPRLLKIEPNGQTTQVAAGEKNGPWLGVAYHDGAFFVAEGGTIEGGRILRITPDGEMTRLVENLPSFGDHHTNGPAVGNDGYIYFGQGTATNSGVVGPDNYDYGWLSRKPEFHDIPCEDIVLAGQNFESDNPLTPDSKDKATTGAFLPFGQASQAGQIIKGRIPCSGAVFRIPATGGEMELVAWGFRNPFGLAFSPEGRLFVTDNAYDTRGSRPGYGNGDWLWAVNSGTWYGWPDYSGGDALNTDDYQTNKEDPKFILAKHPAKPPRPVATLGVHSSSNGFSFSSSPAFGYEGQAFIAQFGDMAPEVGRIYGPVGYKVVRVDVKTGVITDFAVNKGKTNGPASQIGGGGIERPIDTEFDPSGQALYVVDFGIMPMTEKGPAPRQATGVLWKITSEGGN